MKPIVEIAKKAGIKENELELYGKYKAKVSISCLNRLKNKRNGKYIVVTGISPTKEGEGKTLTSIGVSLAISGLNKKVFTCLREPSMGPLFGMKGGATGAGMSRILPEDEINFHFTGDTHAVSIAHNLLSSLIDSSIYYGNPQNIDTNSITWPRVVDLNDRALRKILVGIGLNKNGFPREEKFEITAASEVMAILSLSKDLRDLRKRLGNIAIGITKDKKEVKAENLKCAGAMALLLKDAIKPNLVQTNEASPAFVHTGPFGNIAPGNSSIISDIIALKLSDYVVTESGFGSDLGFEKFINIKCRTSGLKPSAAILVCTIRAIKIHGIENIKKHIDIVRTFGIPVVIAINKFKEDSKKEIDFVLKKSREFDVFDCCVSQAFEFGEKGAKELAAAVIKACKEKNDFRFLYELNTSIKEKIEIIARKIYGAKDVEFSNLVEEKLELFTKLGYASLPICMAKTRFSLSHDPKLKGVPENFIFPINDIRLSSGAGFIVAFAGKTLAMPALPEIPACTRLDI